MYWDSIFSITTLASVIDFLIIAILKWVRWCLIVVCTYISLTDIDAGHCFYTFLAYLYFFRKISLQITCLFLNWIVCLFLLSLLLIFWILIIYRWTIYKYFSHSLRCLFTLLILLQADVPWFDRIQFVYSWKYCLCFGGYFFFKSLCITMPYKFPPMYFSISLISF